MDVKYISNPPDRFLPFLPHFPEASTYPKGGKRVHCALLLLPIPGGNFPIFSPSAAEGVREGKEGMGRANLMIAMWRGTGGWRKEFRLEGERGEGGFFEAPGHPCRGKKKLSSLSLLLLPVQIPFLLQKNLLEA